MLEPILIKRLLSGGWEALDFEPFREGIMVSWILRGTPAIAVLKYEPGAAVPKHLHTGVEMIIVLAGTQYDERGYYQRGDLVINPINSQHEVSSNEGCVVLLHWNKPVEFLPYTLSQCTIRLLANTKNESNKAPSSPS